MLETCSTCLFYLAPCHEDMQKDVAITLFKINQNLLSISLRRHIFSWLWSSLIFPIALLKSSVCDNSSTLNFTLFHITAKTMLEKMRI